MGDYIRWAPPYYGDRRAAGARHPLLALPLAQPRQALGPARPQERGRPRGVAAPGRRLRRRPRRLPPRRPRPARGRLRAHARGQPGDRLLRDHRLRPGRPLHPARRPRHELPRPGRAARPDRRQGRPAGPVGRPDRRPRRRRPDGRLRGDGGAARARAAPARGRWSTSRWPTAPSPGWRWSPAATSATARCRGAASSSSPAALVCYLPYEAADGWVSCGALEPKFWAAFCNGVGRPDLIEKQFEAPGSEAWQEIAAVFRSRTREEWRAFNDEHDCCIEPVLDLDEALDSELVRAREMVVELEQPELGTVRQLGDPVKLSRTPGDPTRPAPGLRRAHRARSCARPATPRRRSRRCSSPAPPPGPTPTASSRSSARERTETARAAADGRAGRGLGRARRRRSSTTCARACCRSRSRPAATWPTTRPSSSTGSS